MVANREVILQSFMRERGPWHTISVAGIIREYRELFVSDGKIQIGRFGKEESSPASRPGRSILRVARDPTGIDGPQASYAVMMEFPKWLEAGEESVFLRTA